MSKKTPLRIHFHVGAHKTATTYMQGRLRANQERLVDREICFVDLWRSGRQGAAYRAALRAALEGKSVHPRKQREASDLLRRITAGHLPRDAGVSPLFVFSCEVVLGNYAVAGGIYTRAKAGIEHMRAAFPDADMKLFLCVRSFDRFLESGYVQRVLGRPETRTFDEYLAKVDVSSLSWVPAIEAIESVVGRENLSLWSYEDFAANEGAVWKGLLGVEDWEAALAAEVAARNPSLSRKGLDYKRKINQHVAAVSDPDDRKKFRKLVNDRYLLNFLKEHFGVQNGGGAPRLFDAEKRKSLAARYRDEIAELKRTRTFLT